MDLIYPSESDMKNIVSLARDYASKSQDHTHEFDGFKGGDPKSKFDRIFNGRIGQGWLYEVCRLNGIPYIEDETPYHKPDNYDVIICDKVFDAKTTTVNSRNPDAPYNPQVRTDLKINKVDMYCFLEVQRTPDDISAYVTPLGIVPKSVFWDNCVTIGRGEQMPGANFKNKFSQTSVLELPKAYRYILDFELIMEHFCIVQQIATIAHGDIKIALDIQKMALVQKLATKIGADDLSSKPGKLVRNHYDMLDIIAKILGPGVYPSP